MATITQNADGSYSKSYSDLELSLVKGLVDEAKLRQQGDRELWIDITGVSNRVQTLEDSNADYVFLQDEVLRMMKEVEKSNAELSKIDLLLGIDTYSEEEVNQLLSLWFVEQIPHVFTQPRSSMFNNVNIDDLTSGYKGYLLANINEPHDNHIPENTMQRYTINAFMEVPKQVTFHVSFADRCTFVLNGVEEGVWADSGGNFSSVPKVLVLDFKEGWNKVQIMISNETQRGGLVVNSDLYEKADYLHNLSNFAGMITGSRIASGTIDEHHLSPNMDLVVNTLHATAENKPAVIVGNPEACGILQIGDKTISKCINEPFVFDDGIRVNGYIYVSQLLIDKDFVLEGDGIFIEKQIDVTTGFTEAYIIHNDMVINNGGGLTIVGDARKGYTITNAMKLIVDGDLNGWLPPNPEKSPGGLDISGDAVKGYYIRNNMLLRVEGTGGLLVTGNAHDGYHIKNIMNLSSPKGLEVVGDPSEAAGYKLRNKMTMTGSGVKLTGSIDDGSYYNWDIENDTKIHVGNGLDIDKIAPGEFKIWNILEVLAGDGMIVTATGNKTEGFKKYVITNDMKLSTTCGGISVKKEGDGHWSIKNTMQMINTPNAPITRISGDACGGYIIESAWPTLNADLGIQVSSNNNGVYSIKNTGVVSISPGLGISTNTVGNGVWQVANTGVVSIAPGTGITASSAGNGLWQVGNTGVIQISGSGIAQVTPGQYPNIYVPPPPPPPPQVTVSGGSGIIVGGGPNYTVSLDPSAIPEAPPPIIINPGGGDEGGGGGSPATSSVIASGHGVEATGGFRKITKSTSASEPIGFGRGDIIWNDGSTMTLSIPVAVGTSITGSAKVYARVSETATSSVFKEYSATFSGSAVGPHGQTIATLTIRKSDLPDMDKVSVGLFVDDGTIKQADFLFKNPTAQPG